MVSGWSRFYVPWADNSEWNTVRQQIFSSNVNDTIRAYETILMWKLKHDSVPAYIECTYGLLQVMVREYEMTKIENSSSSYIHEHDLQLSYSTALIRFVNHVSSVSSHKGGSLYLAARTQNIPDWIINMRHDAAHGQDLPTLDALHVAAELALEWLLDNYWINKENLAEKNLDSAQLNLDSSSSLETDFSAQLFFKKALDIWEVCYDFANKGIVYTGEMDREIILLIEEMLNLNNLYFPYVENDKVIEIQQIIEICKYTEEKNLEASVTFKLAKFKGVLIKYLKNLAQVNQQISNSFVLSLLETKFLSDSEVAIRKWEKILHLIQEIGAFSTLLQVLFELAGKGSMGASKWLSVLPESLKHLKLQWAMFKVLKKENNNFKTKILKQRIMKKCRPKMNLVVKLDIFKPPLITLDMMAGVLLNPDNIDPEALLQFIKLIKPPLVKETHSLMKHLVQLQCMNMTKGNEQENLKGESEVIEEDEKIFTVEDLENAIQKKSDVVCEEAQIGGNKKWVKSSIDIHVWSKCPLGLLPFQTKVDCSLPENLKWKRNPSTRKRTCIPLMNHSTNMKQIKIV